MLELRNIVIEPSPGDPAAHALRGVSIAFRESEAVALLGASGSGKTTLLRLLAGLERRYQGEILFRAVDLRTLREGERDSFRAGSLGLILRDGALLEQLSALENVELALTLTGVSRSLRRRRAIDALRRVGLGDKLRRRAGELSAYDRQRVAVARAVVNDPDIILADEPTGELETSDAEKLTELLRELARNRLVIVATHDERLAERFAERIVRLSDGKLIDDEDPYTPTAAERPIARKRHSSLGLRAALRLSFAHLSEHKGRTLLSILAAALGVIGAALLLSLSDGIERELTRAQSDTLADYPITVTAQGERLSSRIEALSYTDSENAHGRDAVYAESVTEELLSALLAGKNGANALSTFRDTLLSSSVRELKSLDAHYDIVPLVYSSDTSAGAVRVNPSSVFDGILEGLASVEAVTGTDSALSSVLSDASALKLWSELPSDEAILRRRYEVVSGRLPQSYDELVLIVDEHNEISDLALTSLGLRSAGEMSELLRALASGQRSGGTMTRLNYEELLSRTFRLLLPSDCFTAGADGRFAYIGNDPDLLREAVERAPVLRPVGILRAKDGSTAAAMGYTAALTEYIRTRTAQSAAVSAQRSDPTRDIFTALPFKSTDYTEPSVEEKATRFGEYVLSLSYADQIEPCAGAMLKRCEGEISALAASRLSAVALGGERDALALALTRGAVDQSTAMSTVAAMSESEVSLALPRAMLAAAREEKTQEIRREAVSLASSGKIEEKLRELLTELDNAALAALWDEFVPSAYSDASLEENLARLGCVGTDEPIALDLYASSFADKTALLAMLEDYNRQMAESGRSELVVCYADSTGTVASSASGILSVLRTLLVVFVALSMLLSCILVGALTRISVAERARECAILRSFGASLRDIRRVFLNESLLLGIGAGIVGTALTLGIDRLINLLAARLYSLETVAALSPLYAAALIPLGIALSVLAGVIPAKRAAERSAAEVLGRR